MKKTYFLRFLCLLLAVLLLFVGCAKQNGETQMDGESEISAPNQPFEVAVKEFHKRGNVILDITFSDLKEKNIEPGDIITVTAGTAQYDLPVGTSYSDVDSDGMICRFDLEDSKVLLAINGGSFAEKSGMAVKETIVEDPGYRWQIAVDKITVCLKEKKGYLAEYTLRNLCRTNERSDYAALSDADFANCRAVATFGIKPNTLYRGTTPLQDDLGRNEYTMAFLENAEIAAVLNLADSASEMAALPAYEGSYYASCQVWNAEMDYQFQSAAFGEKVKDCLLFINQNDGPYFIHCKEGKDRTGVLCALLECYFGASLDEVRNDYMQTYINFYHLEKGSESYNVILRANLEKILCELFEVSDLESADLKAEAAAYLYAVGLSKQDLTSLSQKLASAVN